MSDPVAGKLTENCSPAGLRRPFFESLAGPPASGRRAFEIAENFRLRKPD
ncbi:MAG: hypothetical protein JSS81_07790 [Acidobacteria bacterium]|nr:hypothetical protein [Acidobacteriota bacterium]